MKACFAFGLFTSEFQRGDGRSDDSLGQKGVKLGIQFHPTKIVEVAIWMMKIYENISICYGSEIYIYIQVLLPCTCSNLRVLARDPKETSAEEKNKNMETKDWGCFTPHPKQMSFVYSNLCNNPKKKKKTRSDHVSRFEARENSAS